MIRINYALDHQDLLLQIELMNEELCVDILSKDNNYRIFFNSISQISQFICVTRRIKFILYEMLAQYEFFVPLQKELIIQYKDVVVAFLQEQ